MSMLMRSHSQHRQRTLDWREWIPVYGLIQTMQNCKKGRPSIADLRGSILYSIDIVYQGLASLAAAGSAVYLAGSLLDKII